MRWHVPGIDTTFRGTAAWRVHMAVQQLAWDKLDSWLPGWAEGRIYPPPLRERLQVTSLEPVRAALVPGPAHIPCFRTTGAWCPHPTRLPPAKGFARGVPSRIGKDVSPRGPPQGGMLASRAQHAVLLCLAVWPLGLWRRPWVRAISIAVKEMDALDAGIGFGV